MNLNELWNIHNLHEQKKARIQTEDGSVDYNWKSDLEDEEGPGYLPKGYSKKVLELSGIYANDPGKGQGDRLMKLFLATPEARKAELIFLDPSPITGANWNSKEPEDVILAKLVKFYARYGFRHNPKSATQRMWLVRKGEIPDNELPT